MTKEKVEAGDGLDPIDSLTAEEIFDIGLGQSPCNDPELMRQAQTYVAVMYRKQGASYRDIASELSVSLGWAHKLVSNALKDSLQDSLNTVRKMQIDRLETLLAGVWDRASEGGTFEISAALAIMAKIDQAYGIEPPKQVVHTHTTEALNAARNELAKALGGINPPGEDQDGSGEPPRTLN